MMEKDSRLRKAEAQLKALNAKGRYYYDDVVRLQKLEKVLSKKGYTKRQLKDLSPNYYGGH